MSTWGDLAKELFWEMTPQDNYHGTPYTFNKFDDSKFYTGEGSAAHGEGHYSADNKKTGLKYKTQLLVDAEKIRDKFDLPNLFPKSDKSVQDFMIRNKINQLKSFVQDSDYRDLFRNKWINEIKELEDLYNNRVYTKGNLYRVNVPNKNQMLWEYYYMDEQPKYIQNKLKPYLENKKLNDPDFFNRAKFYDMNKNYLGPMGKDIYNDLGREGLHRLGIKGITTFGSRDGAINVTFTGDDIKMANTPWQRFVNRIPKQTLGKIADKVITSPTLKAIGDVSPALGIGSEYLKPLDIIMSQDDIKKQKLQQMFNDAGYEVEIQPDGTYLFKM